MIKHIVLFRLSEETDGLPKSYHAMKIKERLEALKEVIPQIKKIEVHINHPNAANDNFDLILDTEFNNLEDLKAYAGHPLHLEVAEYIAKVRTHRVAIDYEF